MQRTNRWLACQVLFLGALMLLSAFQVSAEIAAPGPEWEKAMRTLWVSSLSVPFVQDWLVCGEFAPVKGEPDGPEPSQMARLRTDYLVAYGGEAAIRPVAGMKVKRADGSEAVWKAVKAEEDRIDFLKVVKNYPADHLAAYAYTTIHRAQAGKAYLSVGSDDSVRIWVNGKLVHEHMLNRWMQPEDDLVEVDFQAGDNAVQVKVEQNVSGWLLCMRVLEVGQALSAEKAREYTAPLYPSVGSTDETTAGKLIINSDCSALTAPETRPLVDVSVMAAGGKIVATQRVPRGDRAIFDPAGWADGAYEIICRTTRADGVAITGHAYWFNGDDLAAVKRLVATAPDRAATTPGEMTHVLLADIAKDRMGADLSRLNQLTAVYPILLEWQELQQANAGGAGQAHPYGFLRLAYRDEIDDAPQFCRVFLPANYDPAKRYPLVVYLHGFIDGYLPDAKWGESNIRKESIADRFDVIVLRPYGRMNTNYVGLGEQDVLRCIAMAKERFKIDENRVYLTGSSMGGTGTWNIASRHPELFAAIAPIYGGSDYIVRTPADKLALLTKREYYRRERESAFGQMEALLTTPVFVNHGDSDSTVPVDFSRYAVRTLQRWGYDVQYWEHPDKGHFPLGNDDAIISWLLTHTRVNNPRQVRVHAGDLRSAAAQWVRIEQREQEYAFMQADAEVVGPNTIRLDTDNVLAVTLSPQAPLIDPAQPLRVLWNGRNLPDLKLTDGRVTLDAPGYTPQAGEKTPKVAGPLGDIFNTPFAIVVGTTSPDPLMRALIDRFAQRQIAWWQQWQQVPPRVFKDTEITDADRARYSLILIGGPQENAVAKAMSAQIGLQLAPGMVGLPGKTITSSDAGVEMITRHPLNPERYVVVVAANSPAGMSFLFPVTSWDDIDVRVEDGRSGPSLLLAMFDRDWRINEAFTEPADPTAHARALQQGALKYASANVPGKRLYLNELLEAKTEGEYDYICRGVTAQGNALTLQKKRYANGISIGAWAGGTLEYDLTGGNWTHLRGLFGLDASKSTATDDAKKALTATLIITGDGKELYRSKTLDVRAKPLKLDVDVTGIKTLRMEVKMTGYAPNIAINLADLRLER